MMQNRLYLNSHNELFVVDLEQVLYIQADDHYSHVYYASGIHFLIPYGISRIETMIGEMKSTMYLQRMGRKYIVNCRRIFRLSTIKEELSLNTDGGSCVVLHIPKTVLRNWLDMVEK